MAKQKSSYYGQASKITGFSKTTHVKDYYRTNYKNCGLRAKSIRRLTIKIVQNAFPTIHIM